MTDSVLFWFEPSLEAPGPGCTCDAVHLLQLQLPGPQDAEDAACPLPCGLL